MSSDTKHIYLVRHGESRANAEKVFASSEVPLTQKGREQAAIVANRFIRIPINIVLTSDMTRAIETGQIIANTIGVQTEIIEDAYEIVRHSAIIGKKFISPEGIKAKEEQYLHWLKGDGYQEAERWETIRNRAIHVQDILSQRSEQHIVLASHGLFMRVFVLQILLKELLTPQLFLRANDHMRSINSAITYCTFDTNNGWQMHAWNDHAHLG